MQQRYPFLRSYSGRLDLSRRVLTGVDFDGTPVCGAPKHLAKKAINQVTDLLEALYWVEAEHPRARRCKYVIESAGDETHDKVLPALGTLLNGLQPGVEVMLELEGRVIYPSPPNYLALDERMHRWVELLDYRPALPPALMDFSAALLPLQFNWHRPISSKVWSGRLFGTSVCTVDDQGHGLLSVGKPGRNVSVARQKFLEAADIQDSASPGRTFELSEWPTLLPIIKRFAEIYPGSDDPSLANRILGQDLTIDSPNGPLEPLFKDVPFQFPAVWNLSAKEHRSIDVLMKDGDRPVVVELSDSNQGESARHGIVQAVLNREFIRGASGLHPWFESQGVNARNCEAILAQPTFIGGQADQVRALTRRVSERFVVPLVEV